MDLVPGPRTSLLEPIPTEGVDIAEHVETVSMAWAVHDQQRLGLRQLSPVGAGQPAAKHPMPMSTRLTRGELSIDSETSTLTGGSSYLGQATGAKALQWVAITSLSQPAMILADKSN